MNRTAWWHKFPGKNLDIILLGFAKLLDSILMIGSLGFYISSLHMDYVEWRTRRTIKAWRRNEE